MTRNAHSDSLKGYDRIKKETYTWKEACNKEIAGAEETRSVLHVQRNNSRQCLLHC